MKKLLLAALLVATASAAQAHEVWVERDGDGPARIYLGEPAEVLPEGGDTEFAKLKAPRVVGHDGAQVRKAGFVEVQPPAGDVRVIDDNVFEPWGEAGKKEGVIYYARAGRSDTAAKMPVEIAPATAGGDRFVVLRDGKPVAGAKVTVITPDKWSKAFVAGADGAVSVPVREKGRYLLTATLTDTGTLTVPGGQVATLYRIATISFVAP